jgi:hypothetical protein
MMRWEIGHYQRLRVAFAVGDNSVYSERACGNSFMDQSEGERPNVVVLMDGRGEVLKSKGRGGSNEVIFTQ